MLSAFVEFLKKRIEPLFATKSIATIAGLVLTMFVPNLEPEVRAGTIAFIVSGYNLAKAWQNRAVILGK